jgi:hypothetical protein
LLAFNLDSIDAFNTAQSSIPGETGVLADATGKAENNMAARVITFILFVGFT